MDSFLTDNVKTDTEPQRVFDIPAIDMTKPSAHTPHETESSEALPATETEGSDASNAHLGDPRASVPRDISRRPRRRAARRTRTESAELSGIVQAVELLADAARRQQTELEQLRNRYERLRHAVE